MVILLDETVFDAASEGRPRKADPAQPGIGVDRKGHGRLGVRECAVIELDTDTRIESLAGDARALHIEIVFEMPRLGRLRVIGHVGWPRCRQPRDYQHCR